jgi:hypothetical protein
MLIALKYQEKKIVGLWKNKLQFHSDQHIIDTIKFILFCIQIVQVLVLELATYGCMWEFNCILAIVQERKYSFKTWSMKSFLHLSGN